MVEAFHWPPLGLGILSALRDAAILRGLFPVALQLADVLELQPTIFELPEQTWPNRRLRKKVCPQLISHPKDGAVIYQEGNVLPIRSNVKGTVWYLNGNRAVMNKQNIVIQDGGFYKLTAAIEACRQTIVFEVQKH